MKKDPCPHCGTGKVDPETIYWQLGFLASVVGQIPYRDEPPSENDYCGLMTLLYEIADKVCPEMKSKRQS